MRHTYDHDTGSISFFGQLVDASIEDEVSSQTLDAETPLVEVVWRCIPILYRLACIQELIHYGVGDISTSGTLSPTPCHASHLPSAPTTSPHADTNRNDRNLL